jgi:CHAD domain-containing protein
MSHEGMKMREYVRVQTGTLLRGLASQVDRAARTGDAEAIHDLRVAIRRLSRCLRVFAHFYPGQTWKPMRRRLSGLMEACGGVRDRDIAIELLEKAGVGAAAPLVRKLDEERRAAHEELRRDLRRWNRAGLLRRWSVRLEL